MTLTTIINEREWEEAHSNNVNNKPRSISKTFDSEIDRVRKSLGIPYEPFAFQEQWQFIKETFYRISNANGKMLIARQYKGLPDDFIHELELQNTLYRKYGDKLHPLIEEWAAAFIDTTAGVKYDPSTSDAFIDIQSTRYRNSYISSQYKPLTKGLNRPLYWQLYLDKLMPRNELCTLLDGTTEPQQHYFEAYLAQRLQNPSEPPLIAILLRGEHGTGKNFWIDNIMKYLLGESNCIAVGLNQITGTFTKDLYTKLLVHIEEMNASRVNVGDKLKKLITEDSSRVEGKNINATVEQKYFGIVASSNHYDPVRIEQNDRRWFVPTFSKHQENTQETKVFFSIFANWLESSNGLQEMTDYLYNLDISGYDFRSPPHTSAKEEIMEQNTTIEDNTSTASVELYAKYTGYVFALSDVVREWKIPQSAAKKALQEAGFQTHKVRWKELGNLNRWIHKSLVPKDGDWNKVSYQVFRARDTFQDIYHMPNAS